MLYGTKKELKYQKCIILPFANVRSGKPNEEDTVEEYMFSTDWANLRKYPYNTYKAFDPTDNKGDNASQIFYFYNTHLVMKYIHYQDMLQL